MKLWESASELTPEIQRDARGKIRTVPQEHKLRCEATTQRAEGAEWTAAMRARQRGRRSRPSMRARWEPPRPGLSLAGWHCSKREEQAEGEPLGKQGCSRLTTITIVVVAAASARDCFHSAWACCWIGPGCGCFSAGELLFPSFFPAALLYLLPPRGSGGLRALLWSWRLRS